MKLERRSVAVVVAGVAAFLNLMFDAVAAAGLAGHGRRRVLLVDARSLPDDPARHPSAGRFGVDAHM
jgi:hypothetical protein